MANESAKMQNSDAIDRQVDVMARGDDPAQAVRDPRVEAQLDDLLAGGPGPDETLSSLDRQLASLTAELLEGDFVDSNDSMVNGPVGSAGDAPVEAKSADSASAAASPSLAATASEQSVPAAAPVACTPLSDDKTLDGQLAALGTDLPDGDFESASGDMVGASKEAGCVQGETPFSEAEHVPEAVGARSPGAAEEGAGRADEAAPAGDVPVGSSSESVVPAATASPEGSETAASASASGRAGLETSRGTPGASVEPGASGTNPNPADEVGQGSVARAPRPAPVPDAAPARPGRSIGARLRGAAWTSLRRAEPAAKQVAALASKPLEGRPPVIRQSIGWLAIWTAFLAMCALMASLMFRAPDAPETEAEPSTIDVPHEGEAEPAEPRAGENLRGRPIPPPGPHH